MAQENCAPEAPQERSAFALIRANGCRRINLDMRARLDEADRFTGLPRGTAKPYTYLAAFEQAEPYLHLPAQAAKLVAWLVRQTKPQDWEEGSRPIAAPSAERQAEFLGDMSPRAVQMLNRRLWEAGIFVIRDDPQGRRFKHRDERTGRLTKAFGFDLSPLVLRYDEFKKIASDAQIERNRMRKLRRDATMARRGIAQAVEELGAQGHDSEALRQLHREAADLVVAARGCRRSDELAVAVKALERRRSQAEQMLRDLIKPVDTASMGAENDADSTTTTLTSIIKHTVVASEEVVGVEAAVSHDPLPSEPNRLFPETLHITPTILVELAPRLAPYMPPRYNDKSWPAVVEAALFLSGELGVNSTLWARACDVMGRPYAAVALALVSTRSAEHFTSGPGGYFAGMLRKFEKNPQDLCLSRTLWALKNEVWGEDGHRQRRKVEQQRRIETPTRKSRHPDLQPGPRMIAPPEPARSSVGGFVPVGSVLPPQSTAWPIPPATPRPTLSLPSTSKDWKPSSELLEAEQRIKAMLPNPEKPGPSTPRDGGEC